LGLVRELRNRRQALDALSDVASSPVIINLREQETQLIRQEAELRSLYGEKHPRIVLLQNEKQNLQEKIRAEVNRLIQILENEVRIAQTRAGSIESQLGGLKKTTTKDREAEVKLRELERQAQASGRSTRHSSNGSARLRYRRIRFRPTPAS
jgi:uncharacterized protein involved in exopolysaccharide biosynthesis